MQWIHMLRAASTSLDGVAFASGRSSSEQMLHMGHFCTITRLFVTCQGGAWYGPEPTLPKQIWLIISIVSICILLFKLLQICNCCCARHIQPLASIDLVA